MLFFSSCTFTYDLSDVSLLLCCPHDAKEQDKSTKQSQKCDLLFTCSIYRTWMPVIVLSTVCTPSLESPQEIIPFLKHAEARRRLLLGYSFCPASCLPPGWMAWLGGLLAPNYLIRHLFAGPSRSPLLFFFMLFDLHLHSSHIAYELLNIINAGTIVIIVVVCS